MGFSELANTFLNWTELNCVQGELGSPCAHAQNCSVSGKRKNDSFLTTTKILQLLLSHWDFSHGEIRVAFPGESQLRQSRAIQSGTCWMF